MTMTTTRIDSLRQRFDELEIDAIAIEEPRNRRYISGFAGSSGIALVSRSDSWLLTDSRYYERVEREAPAFQLERAGYKTLERLAEILAEIDVQRVGFESASTSVWRHEQLQKDCPDVKWVPTVAVVERLRAVKDPSEIEVIAHAAELTDRAMDYAIDLAKPGMTERELAWAIEVFMRENGAEGLAFDIIVAGGPNGALPHHRASDDTLRAGEPIVIDMGARVDGYHADLTRTISLGPASDPDYLEVWELVNEANSKTRAGLKAGMSGQAADALARDMIADAGYGEQFGHALGHGVGLDIHEQPRLSFAAESVELKAGMVATVEPGVYLPGRFGVRIEDLVVIGDDGVRTLSKAPKSPVKDHAQLRHELTAVG